ncbi:MAG TPA: DUF3489 domain-containing protein [Accumulibacter sp.]|nr:DUF3489 domain-containing protein [Accumulibacter sp.]
MTTKIQLTDTQRIVLEHAADQPHGRLAWFPDNVKGGARKKVIEGLCNKALITGSDADWFISPGGYDAMGRTQPVATTHPDPDVEAALVATEAQWVAEKADADPQPRTRANSKQATVLQMLKRPEGATIPQICETTGWQSHTVRGTFAGAFKRKLGLTITSEKQDGSDRVYRVA